MNKYSSPVRVAIAGATGYAGQELLTLLNRHPEVHITAAMSSSPDSSARPMPRLARTWDGKIEPLNRAKLADNSPARSIRGHRRRLEAKVIAKAMSHRVLDSVRRGGSGAGKRRKCRLSGKRKASRT